MPTVSVRGMRKSRRQIYVGNTRVKVDSLRSSAKSASDRKTSMIGYSIPRHIDISACTSSSQDCLICGGAFMRARSASEMALKN
jgi:hypothetical protein